MRLIDGTELELRTFDDESQLPPYAILSHTWGDEEISLSQFGDAQQSNHHETRLRLRNMAGYQKIVKTCQQALFDGLAYIWVDTCCIDKSSSAELSEAINSMFRWYQMAKVCYAYLDDVDAQKIDEPPPSLEPPRSHWRSPLVCVDYDNLAQARWFSRGWTLQELLASRKVVFYVKNWRYVGNKSSLHDMLMRITGIDNDALCNLPLDKFSIAKRMSWARARVTTRVEDIAYCLMGLFDVNMPLLYGEGTKAFVRLQEEILKDSDDQTLFAWRPLTDSKTSSDGESGLSIFASHPRDFARSKMILSTPPKRGEPYTLTNRGIRMEVPLIGANHLGLPKFETFIAVLNCTRADAPDSRLGIVIQRPDACYRGSDQYVRHASADLVQISYQHARRAKLQVIYLPKKVPEWWRSTSSRFNSASSDYRSSSPPPPYRSSSWKSAIVP